jgi:hypothetical protein
MLISIQHEPPPQQLDFPGAGVAVAFSLNHAASSPRSG